MKKCLLCFHNFREENGYNPKFVELCCKYLHSAFTQENLLSQPNDQTFCSKCLESAVQLACLSDQLDYLQKSISELIFTFSLEILHRRGKRSDYETNETQPEIKLIEFDVSALPNCNAWNISTNNSDTPGSFSRNTCAVAPENVYDDSIENPLAVSSLVGVGNETDVIIEQIKTETNWIDESNYLGQEGNYTTEFPTKIESTEESLISNQETPMLMQKLKFYDYGRNSDLVEPDLDRVQRERMLTTISNPGGRYRIRNPYKQCVESPNIIAAPTDSTTTTSVHKKRTNQTVGNLKGRSQNKSPKRKNIKKNKDLLFTPDCVKKKKSARYKCQVCKKRLSHLSSLRKHRKLHTGVLPFKCDLCDQMFRYKSHVAVHRRIHIQERRRLKNLRLYPFQCETCGKGFSIERIFNKHVEDHKQKMHFKCRECEKCCDTPKEVEVHYKNVHIGREYDFSEDCIIMLK